MTHSNWLFRLFQSFTVALIFTFIWLSSVPRSTICAVRGGQLLKASTSGSALSVTFLVLLQKLFATDF